jgi:hypothetical protein
LRVFVRGGLTAVDVALGRAVDGPCAPVAPPMVLPKILSLSRLTMMGTLGTKRSHDLAFIATLHPEQIAQTDSAPFHPTNH